MFSFTSYCVFVCYDNIYDFRRMLFFNTPLQTVFVVGAGGGVDILFSRCPSVTFWFFNILKRR